MDCNGATERLGSWLDGELTRDEYDELEAHLEGCDRCGEAADALRRQGRVLQLLRPPPLEAVAGPGFWSRMDGRLSREAAHGPRAPAWVTRGLTVPLPVLAGLAALLFATGAWAWTSRTRALEAEAEAARLHLAIERQERLAAPPAASVRAADYRTAKHTPHRGTF